MTGPGWSPHLEVLPGWEYLTVTLDDDEGLEDEHAEALGRFVADALEGHPHRLYRGERWMVVAVGPPDAASAAARLDQALAAGLGAVDEPWPEERGSSN